MIYRSIHCAMRIKKYENLSKKAKLEMINKEIAEESKKKKKKKRRWYEASSSIHHGRRCIPKHRFKRKYSYYETGR